MLCLSLFWSSRPWFNLLVFFITEYLLLLHFLFFQMFLVPWHIKGSPSNTKTHFSSELHLHGLKHLNYDLLATACSEFN